MEFHALYTVRLILSHAVGQAHLRGQATLSWILGERYTVLAAGSAAEGLTRSPQGGRPLVFTPSASRAPWRRLL